MQSASEIVDTLKARQQMLLKMRSNPQLMEAAYVHYKTHPVDFINDWAMTYDPRLETKLIPFVLFPKQAEYIEWLYDRYNKKEDGLVEKSRDMGATWLCCAFSVWMWLFMPQSSIAFGSRKEDLVDKLGSPDCIFEKIRILIAHIPVEFMPVGFDMQTHAPHMKIINPQNGSNIKGEAGDNIGRGGRSSIYFKDEAAFYERPEKIDAALSMNSDVKIDVSTPNGNGNPFYRKRHGGKIPVFVFDWRDDPRKTEEWYQKQLQTLDPVIVAQEIDRDYNASVGNVLINSDDVRDAMNNRHADVFGIGGRNQAPFVLGVDVARFGEDRTVIVLRQGRHIHWYRTITKADNTQIVGEVIDIIREQHLDGIFVDVVGVGSGVFDMLNERYDFVYAVNGGSKPYDDKRYFNRRAEMWGKMREWFKDRPAIVPNKEDMFTDICSLQYKFNSSGQLVLEKKEDAKKRGVRSPDIADAIALTFAKDIGHRGEVAYSDERYDDTRDDSTGY